MSVEEGTGLSLESLSPVMFGPAQSLEELKQAYGLVYLSYLERGYIRPTKTEMRFGVHNLLPETTTFVAMLRDKVIATVTLAGDSALGVPMDEIYRGELDELRRQGRRVGEVTMLADRRHQFTRTLPMVLALFRMLMDYAIAVTKRDDLCITLNPRHAEFYNTLLQFEKLAEEKSYPSVRDNPAVAMRFALDELSGVLERNERYKKMYERAGRIQRLPLEKKYGLTKESARELAEILARETEITARQREHLAGLYGAGVVG